MKQIQQGDVCLERVDALPSDAKDTKTIVLAEGEVTGHAHRAGAKSAKIFESQGRRFLSAPRGTMIEHEEHGTVKVPPGVYEIGIVQEWDHFQNEARQVAD